MEWVVVGNRFPWPLRDGGAQASYLLLNSLAEKGLKVVFFSFNTKKHWVDEQQLKSAFNFLEYQSFPKDSTPTAWGALGNLFSKRSYHVQRYYDVKASEELKSCLSQLKEPKLWVEGLYSVPLIEPLLPWIKERNIPVYYRAHNIEYQIWERVANASTNLFKQFYLNLQSRRLKLYEEKCWTWFNCLMPITSADADTMQSCIQNRQEVVGVNERFPKILLYQPGFADVEKRILSVKESLAANGDSIGRTLNRCFHLGSMEWEANKQSVEWFLKNCWPRIREKNNLAEFHLAGKGLQKNDNRYRGEGVVVHGEVESSSNFISQHGISVVPLLSGSGIRMKILEAMLMGSPVVTTSIGMQGLAVLEGMELQIANDAMEFAEKVLELMGNPDKMDFQRKLAWEFLIKNHNESANIQRIIDALMAEVSS